MPTLRLLFVVLLAAFVVHTSRASAQQDPRVAAKQHYENGRALFAQGKYQDAIAEFQTADQLAPSGVNDFNIAYAYDQMGDATNAVKFYQSYLTRVPDASNKQAVEDSIARLNQQLSAESQAKADADAAAVKAKADADAAAAAKAKADADAAAAHQPPVPPGGTQTAASTGDPELDRVNGIDVNSIRDQRRGVMPAGAVAANGATANGTGAPPAPGAPAPGPGEAPKKSKPLYKQWWFWVVAGVSAYVLISILTSSSSTSQPGTALTLPPPTPGPTPTTAGLSFHF